MDSRQVITPEDAAEISGMCVKTIYKLLNKGEIKGAKLGRRWHIGKAYFYDLMGIDEFMQDVANADAERAGGVC